MVSVIVCSRGGNLQKSHCENVAFTIGTDYEYIKIDNSQSSCGICEAYNNGVAQATGDICVFVHEDAFFLEQGWGRVLEHKFTDPSVGLVGVAGTQYLFADDFRWHTAGRPFTRGRVLHELNRGNNLILTVLNWDKADADVVVVDGLFFAIRTALFDRIGFDAISFPGFHFYDLDISMQVRETSRCIVTWDILLKHLSAGQNDSAWFDAAKAFGRKYRNILPASCVSEIPDRENPLPALNYDVTNKLAQSVPEVKT